QMVAQNIVVSFQEFGASALSFPPIVAFGSNAANPHHMPTSRRLRNNEMVKLDFGCVYKNKCSDMTRTLFFGSPDARFKKLYALVLRAQERAIAKIRSDVSCGAIDRAARGMIERAGFGRNFVHGTGHGISEFVHELPLLRPKATDRLTAGQVVTVEPGIYIKGWGGIRIEDMVLVKKGGHDVITKSKKRPSFSVIHYLEEIERFPLDTNRHIATLSAALEQELTKKIGDKPLPSIKKQLARLKTV
ncbi:MAG: M24 family metallopeptidase, partial [Candidatus Yonathbacteria bacterium]|nr:M24 family metallopeptidase [Candidatus Yonathbacteria bacterium]